MNFLLQASGGLRCGPQVQSLGLGTPRKILKDPSSRTPLVVGAWSLELRVSIWGFGNKVSGWMALDSKLQIQLSITLPVLEVMVRFDNTKPVDQATQDTSNDYSSVFSAAGAWTVV